MDILKELEKHGLTEESYEQILNTISDKKDGISDLDWSDICEKYSLKLNKDSPTFTFLKDLIMCFKEDKSSSYI